MDYLKNIFIFISFCFTFSGQSRSVPKYSCTVYLSLPTNGLLVSPRLSTNASWPIYAGDAVSLRTVLRPRFWVSYDELIFKSILFVVNNT